jgi:hypothetical protein
MNGDGKVVVHRWFEDGENWATHPWFGGRERQLLAALARHIQAAEGVFEVPGLGGMLVGETVPDTNCPDPKARSRHPTILRAVFVSQPPTDRQRRTLLADLRRLHLPPAPGADARLEIRAPKPRNPKAQESPEPKSKKALFLLAAAVGLIVVVGLIIGALYQPGPSHNRPTPPPPAIPTPPATGKPAPIAPATGDDSDLTPVGGEVPYLNERTTRRFKQVIDKSGKYDHPYVVFLTDMATRLPESAPSCKDAAEVRQGLRKLHDTLLPGDETAEWPADRLRQAIDKAMNYDEWRQKAGRRVYRDRDKPLNEPLRRFVGAFRTPEPALRDIALAMATLLETWGEARAKEQAAKRPLTTIDRFFALLVRPANLPSPLKIDHPQVAFLHRLPPEPVAEGQTFDDPAEVAVALRHLIYLLDRDFAPRDDKTPAVELLQHMGEQMDYTMWLKGRKDTYRDSGAELPPEVTRAIKRFEH